LPTFLHELDPLGTNPAASVADAILAEALRLDDQRPQDDTTIAVIKILPHHGPEMTRRLFMQFPI
jgi:hypothetical protein